LARLTVDRNAAGIEADRYFEHPHTSATLSTTIRSIWRHLLRIDRSTLAPQACRSCPPQLGLGGSAKIN